MHIYVQGRSWETPEQRAALADSKPGTPIRFVASTEGVARDKMTIAADGWQLKNFRANPVFLWVHDYMGQRPPIGRVEAVKVEGSTLVADVTFDQDDPFAVEVERKYRRGYLSAVSVGWDTQEFEPTDANQPWNGGKVLKAELLDISAVPVPGDPKALMERQKRALADFGRDLLNAVEPDDPEDPALAAKPDPSPTPSDSARTTWDEDAPQMMRLFSPFAQRPDEERRKDYARLARAYSRHHKTPPEFLPQADIDALGEEELRGLFLAGEPETFADVFVAMTTRAGAVLSQRNRDDLDKAAALNAQAADLIRAVLTRAAKEAKTDDMTDVERGADDPAASLAKMMGLAA